MTAVASTGRVALLAFAALALVSAIVGCSLQNAAPQDAAPEVAGPPVVVAAGDIADCRTERGEAATELTAELVNDIQGTVLALGDLAVPRGSAENFQRCYDRTWGYFKGRTRPVPGDHEYYTEGAAGYFDYFGEAAGEPGYYSYDLAGDWHIVALNSVCTKVGSCRVKSHQGQWLKEDLAANDDKTCTLAYFHHPLFSSGKHRPGVSNVGWLWKILYKANVDVVLSAGDRNYQRFAPQDPSGKADPQHGIREFVVGTGGGQENHAIVGEPVANSEVHNDETDGVLKLTLRPKGYDWRFVPVEGETFTDSGSAGCH